MTGVTFRSVPGNKCRAGRKKAPAQWAVTAKRPSFLKLFSIFSTRRKLGPIIAFNVRQDEFRMDMMDIFAIDLMPSKGKSDAPTASGRPDETKTSFRDALTDARATSDDRRPERPPQTRPETPRAEAPARTAEAPANPDTPPQDTPAEQEPAENGQANVAEAANTAPASPSAAPAEVQKLVDLARNLGAATPGFESTAVETLVAAARQLAEATGMTDGDWNGFNVLHRAASRVGGLDLGLVPRKGGRDVAGIMAEFVVEPLEMVDVAHDGAQRHAGAAGAGDLDRQRLFHIAAVEQPGQRIADRLFA